MRKRSLFAILGIAALSLMMVFSAGIAFAAGPAPNYDTSNPPDGENDAYADDTEIWADIQGSLITRLEECETFGIIPAGVQSTLQTNLDSGGLDPNNYGSHGEPLDNEGTSTELAQQGPGVRNGVGTLLKTEYIDYNVSGNVGFDTFVFAVADFTEVNSLDTIPVAGRLEIQDENAAWQMFAGLGLANFKQVLDNEDPTAAGDAGNAYAFNLRLDVPDDTLPGRYHTTLTFVSYQV